jgi:SPP1 family predicted phage head-tail adaptor
MRAGRLRHRLIFEESTETASPSGSGEMLKTWNEVGTRWGSVDPLSGKELFTAQQTSSRVSHRITIRNRPPARTQPPAQLRIRISGQTSAPVKLYHPIASLDWESRGIESTIFAEEKVGAEP